MSVAHGDLVHRHGTVPRFLGAAGCRLTDTDGYAYLDAEASSGTANLGFDASILAAAASRVAPMPNLPSFCESPLREKVAARLADRVHAATGRRGRIAFESGGAQGVELALAVVRANTGRTQLAVLEGAYHGRSGLTAQLSAGHRYRRLTGDWRLPVVRLPYPDPVRSRLGESPGGFADAALAWVDQLTGQPYASVADGEPDVAALIVEPVLNAGGVVWPDPAYLRGIVERFRALGALIVVDEVFCGFHRTGPAWGFEHHPGLDPDVVVTGKALTNGLAPLTCVWARDPLMDPDRFRPGTHASTFQTTPFALAVADEVLDRYDVPWTDRVAALGTALQEIVADVVDRCPGVLDGWARGGVGRVRLAEPVAARLAERALTVARDDPVDGVHGLLLSAPGLAPDVLGLAPPLVTGPEELVVLHTLLLRVLG